LLAASSSKLAQEMEADFRKREARIEVNEVVQVRRDTSLSRAEFPEALRISRRMFQQFGQGRRSPSGIAKALIRIALRYPKVVLEVLEVLG
jgi:putative transcriptional regulator